LAGNDRLASDVALLKATRSNPHPSTDAHTPLACNLSSIRCLPARNINLTQFPIPQSCGLQQHPSDSRHPLDKQPPFDQHLYGQAFDKQTDHASSLVNGQAVARKQIIHLPPSLLGSSGLSGQPVRSWVLPPVLFSKVITLCNNLGLRPPEAAQSRVVAVDGCDVHATQTIVKHLYEEIHTNHTVHVFQPLAHTAVDESSLSYYIDQWDIVWRSLVPFPSEVCVNIVPFSPLMITLKAESSIRNADAVQAWPCLASRWQSTIRPDITIHVLEANSIPNKAGMAWFSGPQMNTLAVSKLPWVAGAVDGISLEQLRRIWFEVTNWLKYD